MSTRWAFLLEFALMVANNLIFFFLWWIFFRQFDEISGWKFDDMAILMAVGMGGYGLMQICFGGVKDLAKTIVSGDLDSLLTQPKNVLLHIAGSRSLTKGWGHLGTTAILILFTGMTSPKILILIFLSMLCGCIVYTSFTIIVHSMAFWAGPIDSLSRKYCDALFLFALYPTNIYSGFLQVIMFTLIPAGVIGYLPVELVRGFSWIKLGLMLGSAFVFLGVAVWVFHRGLKRYV